MTPLKQEYILLRGLIGFLGSKSGSGWWDCDFMSPTGISYLRYTYPKSVNFAALSATTGAAQRFHDQHIGRGEVFHLFRLPMDLESDLLEQLKRDESHVLIYQTKDEAMSALTRIAERQATVTPGPINIGDKTALGRREKLRVLAGIYLKAFSDGLQSLPYFVQKDG